MRRALKWVWAPALLGAALVIVPAKEAQAQQSFGYFYNSPRVSIGFSSGYAPIGFGAPYVGYYRAPAFCPPPVCAPPVCAVPVRGPRPQWGYYPPYGRHHHHYRGPARRW